MIRVRVRANSDSRGRPKPNVSCSSGLIWLKELVGMEWEKFIDVQKKGENSLFDMYKFIDSFLAFKSFNFLIILFDTSSEWFWLSSILRTNSAKCYLENHFASDGVQLQFCSLGVFVLTGIVRKLF